LNIANYNEVHTRIVTKMESNPDAETPHASKANKCLFYLFLLFSLYALITKIIFIARFESAHDACIKTYNIDPSELCSRLSSNCLWTYYACYAVFRPINQNSTPVVSSYIRFERRRREAWIHGRRPLVLLLHLIDDIVMIGLLPFVLTLSSHISAW